MGEALRPQPGRPGVYRHRGLSCLACGTYVDAMTNTERGGVAARDGDFSVCVRCGVVSILVVGPLGVAFREPTPDELNEFMAEYSDVIAARRQYLDRPDRASGCTLPGHQGCTVWECRPRPDLT